MAAKPLPHISIPLVNADGTITLEWFRYLQGREAVGLSNLPDVSTTAPADGQVLIWTSATKKWTPGAN